MSITVWNFDRYKEPTFPKSFEFVVLPSVLGNPFVMGEPDPVRELRPGMMRIMSREDCYENYRKWLHEVLTEKVVGETRPSREEYLNLDRQWACARGLRPRLSDALRDPLRRRAVRFEAQRLLTRWLAEGELHMVCYCVPLSCHATALGRALQWLNGKNLKPVASGVQASAGGVYA